MLTERDPPTRYLYIRYVNHVPPADATAMPRKDSEGQGGRVDANRVPHIRALGPATPGRCGLSRSIFPACIVSHSVAQSYRNDK